MADDVLTVAERANQDVYRQVARRTGGRIIESGGLCLIHGNHPSWVLANCAFRTDPNLAAGAVIDRVVESFRRLARRPTLMTFERPDGDLDVALAAAGWTRAIELPVMVKGAAVAKRPVEGATLRWLKAGQPGDLEVLRDVLRRGFAEDEEEREVVDSLFAGPESFAGPDAAAVIATLDAGAAACAMIYRVGDVAVVGWVATVPEARRRGLGRLVTAATTNRGFQLGAAWLTLQASPMGEPLYRSMGFETVTSSRVWIGPKSD
jgi:GNAT superfamily N-acetyltransferase